MIVGLQARIAEFTAKQSAMEEDIEKLQRVLKVTRGNRVS